ncbi:unnamed protein product, partial [marine sediment metagenome]
GEVVIKGKRIHAKYILAAPGRVGADWFAEQARNLGVKLTHGPIDVGVRVEVPAVVYEPVVKVNRDPKFHIRTKTFDDFVRTFCTNSMGWVMEERYDDHVGVNGHSLRAKKSQNTNFALLIHIETINHAARAGVYTPICKGRRCYFIHGFETPHLLAVDHVDCANVAIFRPDENFVVRDRW